MTVSEPVSHAARHERSWKYLILLQPGCPERMVSSSLIWTLEMYHEASPSLSCWQWLWEFGAAHGGWTTRRRFAPPP